MLCKDRHAWNKVAEALCAVGDAGGEVNSEAWSLGRRAERGHERADGNNMVTSGRYTSAIQNMMFI